MGFPGDSVVKNPPANAGAAGDVDLIPGSGRSSVSLYRFNKYLKASRFYNIHKLLNLVDGLFCTIRVYVLATQSCLCLCNPIVFPVVMYECESFTIYV